MKGDAQVIDFLNKALLNELTAINQYWLHYRMLDNWGVAKLAEYERHESIDEMKHADMLAERILFLEGLPNFQALGKLHIGENVEEILKADLAVEHEAIPLLKDAIAHCETVRDYSQPRTFRGNPRQRGGACRLPRKAIRHDRADGVAELRPAQQQGSRDRQLAAGLVACPAPISSRKDSSRCAASAAPAPSRSRVRGGCR